ncbi:MAG: EF-P lysine aminoacylase EpmA [Alphaproteobacteria bacterium]|nr:EF-P lysine aminoacylase EpmA [Alphaproteobacteria bacterium]
MTKQWWQPHIFNRKLDNLSKRQAVIETIRGFFKQRDFLEVDTPALQTSPGLEVHLHAFKTRFVDPYGQRDMDYMLHTSPEFTMKKLLVAGLPRIYSMGKVWRNNERSALHHPEFTMLEWYRAGVDYNAIMQDTKDLVTACYGACGADIAKEWEYLTVADAFEKYAGIDILATDYDVAKLRQDAGRAGVSFSPQDSWDDIYYRIMMDKIEPFLGFSAPTFLCEYPIRMAALSRPKPGNPAVAERVELYIDGLELANGFSELTDWAVQLERFQEEVREKQRGYGEAYPIDMDFIDALKHGMPQCSGIALGVDRLVMAICKAHSIEDVLWAPVAY